MPSGRLHRPEAVEHASRIHGDAAIAPPVSWQAVGWLGAALVAGAGAFLFSTSYAVDVRVPGSVSSAIAPWAPTVPAGLYVARLPLRSGAAVRRGDVLAVLTRDATPASAAGERAAASRQQLGALDDAASAIAGRADDDRSAAADRVAGLQAQIAELARERTEQRGLVASAEAELDRLAPVAGRGFVSGHEIAARRDALAQRRLDLEAMGERDASLRTQLSAARSDARRTEAQSRLDLADARDRRAAALRASADDDGRGAIVVRSPVAGTLESLAVQPGSTTPSTTLLTVVPPPSTLRATLAVPPDAVAFVRAGQEVRLSVSGFPDSVYGTLRGRVSSVATAAVADASGAPSFRTEVELASGSVPAYGGREPLRAGMTLTARIAVRRQSLARWLLDPLYAVGRR